MSITVNAPKTPVTAGSRGVAAATVPNVCKMPGPPAPFVPVPLPNIGKSGDSPKGYSKSVKFAKHAVAIRGATFKSKGDIASKGTGGGLLSSNTHGPTSFVGPGSMNVKVEGKNVQLLSDPMLNNGGPSGSPPNAATLMGVIQPGGLVTAVEGSRQCPVCESAEHKPLEETKNSNASALALAEEYKGDTSAMLGVAHCGKCDLRYAGKSGSGRPLILENAAQELNMEFRRSGADHLSKADFIRDALKTCVGEAVAADAWIVAKDVVKSAKAKPAEGSAYPPGVCAGQEVLALARNQGARPNAMTERWFHPQEKATKGRIEHIDNTTGTRKIEHTTFEHGATVPPCKTCVVLLPLFLCLGADQPCVDKPRGAQ